VPGVAGTWKDPDRQRQLHGVEPDRAGAQHRHVAPLDSGGDLSKKITVNVSGEILQLKETLNTMVAPAQRLLREVTRVARESRHRRPARRPGQCARRRRHWKDSDRERHSMASTPERAGPQHREVTTAVANGDFSKKITVDVRGEISGLKDTITPCPISSTPLPRSDARRPRGRTEGKLGGRRWCAAFAGTWKGLTDSLNSMASNLTARSATSPSRDRGRQGRSVEKIRSRIRRNLQLKETLTPWWTSSTPSAGE